MKLLVLLLLSTTLLASTPPRRPWPGFHGPAYLSKMPRRPPQRVLDSLARQPRPVTAAR